MRAAQCPTINDNGAGERERGGGGDGWSEKVLKTQKNKANYSSLLELVVALVHVYCKERSP